MRENSVREKIAEIIIGEKDWKWYQERNALGYLYNRDYWADGTLRKGTLSLTNEALEKADIIIELIKHCTLV